MKHSPEDIQMFYKYVDGNIASWSNVDFEQIVQLVTVFAEQNMVNEQSKITTVLEQAL